MLQSYLQGRRGCNAGKRRGCPPRRYTPRMLVLDILRETAHRDEPPPCAPWALRQTWYDLLFAHWRVDARALRALVPAQLELDLFAGEAWLAVVPFGMRNIAPRRAPALPWISRFLELNVRTYVRHRGRPGVYFLSLDAANPLAVEIARRWYHLPYLRASMRLTHRAGWIEYRSRRSDPRGAPAELDARYRPLGAPFQAARGTLEHFLAERYRLFLVHAGAVLAAEIHHAPWPLEPAEAVIGENGLARAAGIELPDEPPHLLFARSIDVLVWPAAKAGG